MASNDPPPPQPPAPPPTSSAPPGPTFKEAPQYVLAPLPRPGLLHFPPSIMATEIQRQHPPAPYTPRGPIWRLGPHYYVVAPLPITGIFFLPPPAGQRLVPPRQRPPPPQEQQQVNEFGSPEYSRYYARYRGHYPPVSQAIRRRLFHNGGDAGPTGRARPTQEAEQEPQITNQHAATASTSTTTELQAVHPPESSVTSQSPKEPLSGPVPDDISVNPSEARENEISAQGSQSDQISNANPVKTGDHEKYYGEEYLRSLEERLREIRLKAWDRWMASMRGDSGENKPCSQDQPLTESSSAQHGNFSSPTETSDSDVNEKGEVSGTETMITEREDPNPNGEGND